ncbi:MAG: hypothetical protein AB1Z31_35060 [Desulfobacterales bacterium]
MKGVDNFLCTAAVEDHFEQLFRYEVFKMLKAEGNINDVVIENIMNWNHSGVNVNFGNTI